MDAQRLYDIYIESIEDIKFLQESIMPKIYEAENNRDEAKRQLLDIIRKNVHDYIKLANEFGENMQDISQLIDDFNINGSMITCHWANYINAGLYDTGTIDLDISIVFNGDMQVAINDLKLKKRIRLENELKRLTAECDRIKNELNEL